MQVSGKEQLPASPAHHLYWKTGEVCPPVYLTKREACILAQWEGPPYHDHRSHPHSWEKQHGGKAKRLRKKDARAQANAELDYTDLNLIYDLPRTYRNKYWRCCEYCQGATPEVNEDGTVLVYGSMDLTAWEKLHDDGGFEARCLKGMAQELFIKDANSPSKIGGIDALCLDAAPKVSAAEFLDSDEFAYSDSWVAFRNPDDVHEEEEGENEVYDNGGSDISLSTYINYILRHARATLSKLIHTVPHNAATGISAFWSAAIIRGLQRFNSLAHADPVYHDRTGAVRNMTGCWQDDDSWCSPDPCKCEWCTEEMKVQWNPAARVQTWWFGALIGDDVWDDMVKADRKWEVQGLMRDEWDVGSLAGSDIDDYGDGYGGEVEAWTLL